MTRGVGDLVDRHLKDRLTGARRMGEAASLRANGRAAALISSPLAGGAKLCKVRTPRRIGATLHRRGAARRADKKPPPACENTIVNDRKSLALSDREC